MEAKIRELFDSVIGFFSGGDQIPWCNHDIVAEEIPVDVYKGTDDRTRKWHFPYHDFTLMMRWTRFLVAAEERVINGSRSDVFDLNLDRVDDSWSHKLPAIDYAIVSGGHWFFRKIYLHKDDAIIGCVYCSEPNVTDQGLGFAVRMSFRAALNFINECKDCKADVMTLLRTFSPAHFEDGTWNTGGSCNRTSPRPDSEIELGGFYLKLSRIQSEEIERARQEVAAAANNDNNNKRFGVLDVTKAMLGRADGHPGTYWGDKWMKGYRDCVHWCLPGPIDAWNQFLLAILRKEAGFSPQ